MAIKKATKTKSVSRRNNKSTKTNSNQLQEFLREFENIPGYITDGLLQSTSDEDYKIFINAFSPALNNQFKEVSIFIASGVKITSPQSNQEAERMLRIGSGMNLISGLKDLIKTLKTFLGKLGVADIVQEIKKLIRIIVEAIFKKFPDWLEFIFLIIDQIIKKLLGGASVETRSALSLNEQEYLKELTESTNLRTANKRYNNFDED